MKKTIAYIALGSNLNNPEKQVEDALKFIRLIASTAVIAESSLYESTPLGFADQPNYINQVIAIETTLTAHALLRALQSIENKMGRVRKVRWGSRIIDCDIILFGNEKMATPELTIPHPEYKNRDFVLYPLAEIAPDLVLPLDRGLYDENSHLSRHIRSHYKRPR
ncbi:MAG: 2-amino-4-hydroxy-6-hydroxymethyldihydropteridine diphosphokinase [Gammaproteobacteria bacterium CG_4_10_14_0_8_um_filter_38_16]|nr:MAG: 2-amino-4-hydroxy-6-hydroxymethyldihydropteridine diphosphokinase [Gammaproteobacteria bacterium CG_4_10_14_0_8_um_filter_38_16]PJA02933.1 MAG: 2-amino-4-hydroxy-6-hydroxymethyldihydropteridine diphosphokinase [Gammaproteobacteria bacterium CG_4_10_14_0_2_um_filter_38_22]PJB11400.1 MAG: 2-amino-4-hydroxy-6-hydroxymethyldihydropteridine diphosphokinase [Gammaproteobacteria bacterium CG_4_9_14_3_um_filter_38_9]